MFTRKILFTIFSLFFCYTSVTAAKEVKDGFSSRGGAASPDLWLERELAFSIPRIFRNVSPSDARPGAVVAAQTRNNPNYYFHWVRDAALTMEALIERYNFNVKVGATATQEQQILRRKIMEYFEFCDFVQNIRTIEGLGEPKFNVDGSAFNEPWGRPQNDGPALRALSFIHLAKILINEGQYDFVRTRLYNANSVSSSVIKRDLEFVSHRWRDSSFDLWEEVKGDHFYTRMVQRRALKEGADLASSMGDMGAAQWYANQAFEIERDLQSFWDQNRGYFITTKNRTAGIDYKNSQLDTAFVLGLLHGSLHDGFMSFKDSRVQATMDRIADSFYRIYSVNRNTSVPGIAIGRYPEDLYAGTHFNAGNPWVLTTLAFAEAYYLTASEYLARGQYSRANEFIQRGDLFTMRVQFHSHNDGALNEQIDRNSGYMTSVEDLTWNYGAVLTTYLARMKGTRSGKF